MLLVDKSAYIFEGTNLNLHNHNAETKSIPKNIDTWDASQRVYEDSNFGPTKAKRISDVLVEENGRSILGCR